MANYPNAAPNFAGQLGTAGQPQNAPPMTTLFQNIMDEVVAIAAELGLNPSAAAATVLDRLNNHENLNSPVFTDIPVFINGWSSLGSAYGSAAYTKDKHGWVHLRGVIRFGTISSTAGGHAFTLPAGFRPNSTMTFPVASNFVYGAVDVQSDGQVRVTAGDNAFISLASILFKAA